MLRHIKYCTEEEVHQRLRKKEWSTALAELDAFISILYAQEINSWILIKKVTGKKFTRRKYLQQLIEEMRDAHIYKRKYKSNTQTKTDTSEEPDQMRKMVLCQPFKGRNKVVDTCSDLLVSKKIKGNEKIIVNTLHSAQVLETLGIFC
ncbi:hypothetical protein TNCV_4790501 [Trichonephila clavipes]|nr:hypothetical protein TNCV_4790501 [Trichonephila clavipes]